jgi:hypothetical protein
MPSEASGMDADELPRNSQQPTNSQTAKQPNARLPRAALRAVGARVASTACPNALKIIQFFATCEF